MVYFDGALLNPEHLFRFLGANKLANHEVVFKYSFSGGLLKPIFWSEVLGEIVDEPVPVGGG